MDFVIVVTTTDDRDVAEKIACEAVEAGFAASARISTGVSVFRWEGEIARKQEFVVEIKTTTAAAHDIERVILARHNYELPEIVLTPIIGGSVAYLEWLQAQSAATV